MSKLIIGVTGKSGSGKTTFCTKLAEMLGAYHVNIDQLCHYAIEQNRDKIEKILVDKHGFFNNNILIYNEKSFRQAVGELIFSDQDRYKEIIQIVWFNTKSRIDTLINSNSYVILDHILLPKMHCWEICDRKVLIECADVVRYKRIFDRDNISLEQLQSREQASIEYKDYKFDVIWNTTND